MDNTTNAHEQLRAVETGSHAGISIGRAGKLHDSLYAAAVGALIAAMLAVVVYVYPQHLPWLAAVSTVLYGVGIGVVAAIYRQRRKGTSRVTGKRYRIGFLITMSLYAVGVVLAVWVHPAGQWFWIPYIVATGLPLVIVSLLRAPRER